MPFFIFKCKKCGNKFDDLFNLRDGIYRHAETEKEIGEEPPEKWPCPACNSKVAQRVWYDEDNIPNAVVRGVTDRNRRENRRFQEYGYNKQQATQFYKDSIQASKDRIATMGDVYKKVDCDPQELVKLGKAKKLDDKSKAEKLVIGKKVQQELAKIKKPK